MHNAMLLMATLGFLISGPAPSNCQTIPSFDSLIWSIPEPGHILVDLLDSGDVPRQSAIAFCKLIQDSFPNHHIWIMISEKTGNNALWLTHLFRHSCKATVAGSKISRFPAALKFFETNLSVLRPVFAPSILDDQLWKIIPDIEISPSGKASALPFRSVRKYILRLIEEGTYVSGE
jgi:hypothetical protein